jgi:hypothetical protein
MKSKLKKYGVLILSIIMLLAVSIAFIPGLATKTADVINAPIETVQNVAKTALFVTVAAFLIWAGVLSLAAPIVAGALIITGVVLMWYAIKPYFGNSNDELKD